MVETAEEEEAVRGGDGAEERDLFESREQQDEII